MNPRFKSILPLFVCFCICTAVLFCCKLFMKDTGVDFNVLIAANCLFFLTSLLVFGMQRKAMVNSNPNVFIRSVMGGMMIKMFICIAAVMGYVMSSGKNLNKPAVYISMVIYLVYLVVEVALVMKLNKRKNA